MCYFAFSLSLYTLSKMSSISESVEKLDIQDENQVLAQDEEAETGMLPSMVLLGEHLSIYLVKTLS